MIMWLRLKWIEELWRFFGEAKFEPKWKFEAPAFTFHFNLVS
jgi:hypothetical protein